LLIVQHPAATMLMKASLQYHSSVERQRAMYEPGNKDARVPDQLTLIRKRKNR